MTAIKKRTIKIATLFIAAAVISAAVFLLVYYTDNKYTQQGPQPHNGVLILSAQDLQDYPIIHLITGWEIYRDVLLSPEDFKSMDLTPDEYVFIGQYGGFEGRITDDSERSPHGSATYRLRIELPLETKNYMLELPEIYSAYRLYINGEMLATMGKPDWENYVAETGNTRIMLRTAEQVEILFAVSDYSHFYSGLVYPPAFGEVETVENMLNTRLVIRSFAVTLALGVGLFYLIVWFLLRKSKDKNANSFLPLLYTSLCACFSIYVAYPIVKTLWHGGLTWYTLETLAYPAMLLLAAMIQSRIVGFYEKGRIMITALGIFVCTFALISAFIMSDSLALMFTYSDILHVYTWICALFLLVNAAYSIYMKSHYGTIILTAAIVFATSLVMDRLFPLFEPITFGWFSEISGAVFVISIGLVMAKEIAGQFYKRLALEIWTRSLDSRIEQQEEQFRLIAENNEKTLKARHDLRHQIHTISGLLNTGDFEELKRHLSEYSDSTEADLGDSYCANARVNALLWYYAAKAKAICADITISVNLPYKCGIVDMDLCAIFGNCLENAIAACMTVIPEKRKISLMCREFSGSLVIILDNSYDGKPIVKYDGRFRSTKRDDWGIGLASVASIAEKYNGMAVFTAEGNVFRSEISMQIVAKL
ncbi:MAG: GHKL domain-containing protein [Oscillospiraceae bacterium]|nr:GHKL domain-containing protein [Oscillospiraceae bacterium]